ncbi:enoyl-CoA hydratase/isomerase family protein [Xenorhabdus bovienii]|uniref:polyketide synthase n=1 Tax=Xenorhabdus bovienii TaxID=40576 RepID=UPI0023B22811|nr:polyketide synthase [Xenorhabdus bovienii]MDE9482429.1 enoyl-CoA hydratase/isomerase family protein [Xenorhabdus bovienii]MDE9556305.1 enoyl-CoA hydratase/isomerase family protein [Xenorhabdus bovienii]
MTDSVVTLQSVSPEILLIRMEDKLHKNTFTPALIAGLQQAFADIAHYPQARVVVITGYENYYSTGGTKEGLLALQRNQGTFVDANVYTLALDCALPVISAMQGHAIGGGLVMGLFSDIVILGRESIYAANFMKYGFTPGMGSTHVLPARLGMGLAQEMFYTSRNYRGEELARRGVACEVVPRAEVLGRALEVARMLAEKPRLTLSIFKQHMTRQLRAGMKEAIEHELAMHQSTMHQSEVVDRIERLFGN